MYKIIFFSMILAILLIADDIFDYRSGLKYYQNHQYKKAYPIISSEAKRGNKEAEYLLANMLENGYGVKKDIEKSLYWYKKSASNYSYIIIKSKKNSSLLTKIDNQMDDSVTQKGIGFAFSKLNLTSPELKAEADKIVNRNFGILPYHSNYILPFSHSFSKYSKYYATYLHDNLSDSYDDNMEIEFQLSIQKLLSYNLFGLNEYLSLGYTQQVWWQAYSNSAPFRETNYTPEIFIILPTSYEVDKLYNLKAIQFGFRHQSNGQEGYRSRSWNRVFLTGQWQWDNLFLKVEGWYRIPEDKKSEAFYNGTDADAKGDDNPDIEDYLGYGNIELRYLYGKSQFGMMIRNNLKHHNKGAIELDYSTPFFNSKTTYWYIKGFNGYGESLINYDKSVTKIGFGFAFYRSLF